VADTKVHVDQLNKSFTENKTMLCHFNRSTFLSMSDSNTFPWVPLPKHHESSAHFSLPYCAISSQWNENSFASA